MSSLAPSTSAASFVQIGRVSYSPGDIFVECLVPHISRHDCFSPPSIVSGTKTKSSVQSPETNEEEEGDIEVLNLKEHPSVLRAQAECATLLNGNSVVIVEDEDVKEDVVQITGHDAELVFQCRNIFRYLVLFLKDVEQFIELRVEILDDKQTYRQLMLTNARSLAKVEEQSCQLPIVFGNKPGWRYLCIDLQHLTKHAFGTKHVTTTNIKLSGTCRLLRMYFQDEQYGDNDLPSYLTFLGEQ